jgi:hypothetical protein
MSDILSEVQSVQDNVGIVSLEKSTRISFYNNRNLSSIIIVGKCGKVQTRILER